MTIPNRVAIILACSFFVVAPFMGFIWSNIALHLVGAIIVFGVCFALFALNLMGGGDAKLLAAAALWFGLGQPLLVFVLYVAYIGGLVTVLILMLRWRAQAILAMGFFVPHSVLHAKKIPYGIAIGIGGFLAYPSSPVLTAALARLH